MSNKNLLFLIIAYVGFLLGAWFAKAKKLDEMTEKLKDANTKIEIITKRNHVTLH